MTAVGENNTSLANQCMDFCKALNRQGKDFKFSLTIGDTFSFSLDARGGNVPAPKSRRKKVSPSTVKRNARRKKEFLSKKNTPMSSSEENVEHLELVKTTFKCDQCEAVFKTRNGLKIHIGKSHKEALNSPEKLRETSSEILLTVSPTRENSREEPCPNCGGDMSPTHLCQDDDDDQAVEPKVADKDKNEESCEFKCLEETGRPCQGMPCTCDCRIFFSQKHPWSKWCGRKKISIDHAVPSSLDQ